MKTLILYESIHHGNTQKIVDVMAKAMDAKAVKAGQVDPAELSDYDLIGFGSGIYMWKHHVTLFKLIDKMPQTGGKKAFIFSTRGGNIKQDTHKQLREKLMAKGFTIVAEFTCPGWDTFGPLALMGGINKDRPNETDLEAAKEFAQGLLRK